MEGFKMGDLSTIFFHTVVMKRRRQNKINRMKRWQGNFVYEKEEVGKELFFFIKATRPT